MTEILINALKSQQRRPLPLGHAVAGFRIEAVLGAGRFGIVYRAAKTGQRGRYVLKEYIPAGLATRRSDGFAVRPLRGGDRPDFEWGFARLREQALALAALDHPNLVRVHGLGESHGTGYLVSDYVEGDSLAAELARRGKLPEAEVRYLLDPLLNGLDQVHRVGLVHGGIAPTAIRFVADGAPVLVGFGMVRVAPASRSAAAVAELPVSPYAPHEVADPRASIGPWTDIYSLGAVLYRAVTGGEPIAAVDRVAALDRGAADPLPPAVGFAGVSPRFLAAIDAALAPGERARPQALAALRSLIARSSAHAGTAAGLVPEQPLLFALDDAAEPPPSKPVHAAPPRRPAGSPAVVMPAARRLPIAPPSPVVPVRVAAGSRKPAQAPASGKPAGASALLRQPPVPRRLQGQPPKPPKGRPPAPPAAGPPPRARWPWIAAFATVIVVGALGSLQYVERSDADAVAAADAAAAARAAALRAQADKAAADRAAADRIAAERASADRATAERAAARAAAERARDQRRAEDERAEAEARRVAEERRQAERREAEARQRAEREQTEKAAVADGIAALAAAAEGAFNRGDWAAARQKIGELERAAPAHAALDALRARLVVETASRVARADRQAERRDWDAARKALDEAAGVLPESPIVAAGKARIERAKAAWDAERPAIETRMDLALREAMAAIEAYDFDMARDRIADAEEHLRGFPPEHALLLRLATARSRFALARDDTEFERRRQQDEKQYAANRSRADALFAQAQKEWHERKNAAGACRLYRDAGDLGHVGAQNQLGLCFALGNGVPRDETEAYLWFRRAAEGGNAIGQYNLAHAFFVGAGTSRDPVRGAEWARKSADQGYAKAQCRLGVAARDGDGVAADPAAGLRHFRDGADKGEEWCMALLGDAYERGVGVTADPAAARQWYERAAAKGYEPAKRRLRELD